MKFRKNLHDLQQSWPTVAGAPARWNAPCMVSAVQKLSIRFVTGAVAGIAATGVMSLVMLGAKRVGALGEPPPRRLTRRVLSPLGVFAPRGRALDVTALLAPFAFGASMGGIFGLLPGRKTAGRGSLFGLAVWGVNYAGILPEVGLMPPARRDRPGRPTSMLVAHLVYGAALALVQRAH